MLIKYLKRNLGFVWIVLIVCFVIAIYFVSLRKSGPLAIASLKTNDLISFIKYNVSPQPPQLKDITIVAVDDVSLKYVGKRWPWPRSIMIQIIEKTESYSPCLIGLDLALIGESKDPAEDLALADVFRKYNNIITASHFTDKGEYIRPEKIFRESVLAYGHINMPRDEDLLVRRSQPVILSKDGKVLDFSFEVKVAAKFFRIPFENIVYYKKYIVFRSAAAKDGDIIFSVNRDGTRLINFGATEKEMRIIRAADILENKVSSEAIRDKIVLIGVTSEIFHDVYPTPLGIMSGVLLNANDVLMIISKNPLRRLPPLVDFSLVMLFCVMTIYLTYNRSIHTGVFISLFEIATMAIASVFLRLENIIFDIFGIIFFIAITYITVYCYKYFSLMIENARLRREAITDGLTGLYVYRYFELKLHSEFNKSFIEKNNLSLAILDIDHFKALNDTYGHEEGNFVLKELAALLTKLSRRSDITARYGGEEFCVILLNTDLKGALDFAENIRKQIKMQEFASPTGNTFKITVSIGIAGNKSEGVFDADSLTKSADAALYEAKRSGRDKVCKL